MKKNTWLVVANSSLARIFQIESTKILKELNVMEHPESRMHNRDLVSDKPGRDFESMGVSRHAIEPKTYPKQHEFALFAKSLSDYLEAERSLGKFDDLYIAASPTILGLIRQSLDSQTSQLIRGEIDKDLTQLPPQEILAHLPFPY